MERVAKFEKVTYEQFRADWTDTFGDTSEARLREIYEGIVLPERATAGSAGYDFHMPVSIILAAGKTIKIPTGVRCRMNEGWFLMCVPRSGLGFKYRLQMDNTVGIIDADYYNAKNEGHIFCKITNDSRENKSLELGSGQGFVQAILLPFGITEDDSASAGREGGFGSTDRAKG